MTTDQALEVLKQHVKDDYQILHAKMVATAMREYAKKLGEDAELWYLTGLLHDIDYFEHPDEHPNISVEWYSHWGLPQELTHAVLAHAHDRTGVEPQTNMAKALCAIDELSGLLYAYSLMRPEKFGNMEASSVKKKFKDKAFAKKVSREDVTYGVEIFDVDFGEHIAFLISVFQNMPELA